MSENINHNNNSLVNITQEDYLCDIEEVTILQTPSSQIYSIGGRDTPLSLGDKDDNLSVKSVCPTPNPFYFLSKIHSYLCLSVRDIRK